MSLAACAAFISQDCLGRGLTGTKEHLKGMCGRRLIKGLRRNRISKGTRGYHEDQAANGCGFHVKTQSPEIKWFPTKTSTGARPSKHSASSGASTFQGTGKSESSGEESNEQQDYRNSGKGKYRPM